MHHKRINQRLMNQRFGQLLTLLLLVACGRELSSQATDTLAFTMTPLQPMQEMQVEFSVVTPQAASYRWDFGDGNHAEGAQVQHRYAQAGRYRVSLYQYHNGRLVAQVQQWLELPPNSAQGYGRVQGFVVNRKAGQPVAGSDVHVVGSNIRTVTDARGFYSLELPSGEVSLRFSQAGYAQSAVQGLRVRAGEVSYYDTVQLEAFIPWLPAQAPTVNVQLETSAAVQGPGSSLQLRIDAESSDPASTLIYGLVTVSWEQARGLSSLWDELEAGERLEHFQGSADMRISTTGLAGESRLHVVVHDQNLNRTEVLRYVTITSRSPSLPPLAPQGLQGLAVTFGDIAYSSVTMRRNAVAVSREQPLAAATAFATPLATALATLSGTRLAVQPLTALGLYTADAYAAKQLSDVPQVDSDREHRPNMPQAVTPYIPYVAEDSLSAELAMADADATSDTVSEAITWVDLFFHYPAGYALPEAFEVYRQLEGETGFRRLARLPAEALRYDPEEDTLVDVARYALTEPQHFRYRDASPGLATGLEARYYLEAVNGEARARSTVFRTRALEPMRVESLSPTSEERLTSVLPTYRMRVHNRNRLLHMGILVLDLVQADQAPIMLGLLFHPIDDPNIIFVEVSHREFAPPLQPYHAYEWQAIAMTSDGELDAQGQAHNIRAVAIAADSFSNLGIDYGFPHGVRSGARHVFITGDGSY